MLAEALGGSDRVKKFRRDGWAQPWPVGPEMLCYMLAHEAHHRGQLYMMLSLRGVKTPAIYGLTEEEVAARAVSSRAYRGICTQ
jgi:uncharacterized damage-inducible protein DinB